MGQTEQAAGLVEEDNADAANEGEEEAQTIEQEEQSGELGKEVP